MRAALCRGLLMVAGECRSTGAQYAGNWHWSFLPCPPPRAL